MQAELLKLIENFDVISFDVFDTLLLRPYLKPTDLFAKIGGETFRKERIAAEQKARKVAQASGREEVSFDEIYELLPRWPDMKQRELDEERRCLTANPEMVEVWNRAGELGKKRVIASDMYLPRQFMEEVLREKGIDGRDGFYLSSDCGVQKASGGMFEKIVAEIGVAPQRILHVGDSIWSDVERANDLGLVGCCYPKVSDRFLEANRFLEKFLLAETSISGRLMVGAMALGWHLHVCAHPDADYWDRIGFLMGGALGYGYARWIVERAKAIGIERLLLVARDGYVLRKILAEIAPELSTDYVYISRKSTLFASGYFGSTEYVQRKRRRFCLDELTRMRKLEFPNSELTSFVDRGVWSESIRAAFDAVAADLLREMKAYYDSLQVDSSATALVDGCSMHFTIQRFLRDVMGSDLKTFYLQTDMPAPNAETYWLCDWGRCRFLFLAEFIFGAPTPPVESVRHCVPVFKEASLLPWSELFKISVSDRMADAAVSCCRVLKDAGIDISTLLLSRWVNAFSDNLTADDRANLSMARISIETGHEGNTRPIVRDCNDAVRFVKVFGRVLLSARWQFESADFRRKRVVLLFDRIPLLKVWKWWWS